MLISKATIVLFPILMANGSSAATLGNTTTKASLRREERMLQADSSSCRWIQIGEDIDAERPGDRFGYSAALSADGSRLVVGAPDHDGPFIERSGQARIFDFNSTSNTFEEPYVPLYGVGWLDEAGRVAISSDGKVVAVGARQHDGNGIFNNGHVQVYKLNGTNWQKYGPDIKGDFEEDHFGHWVALNEDGLILAVGAEWFDGPGGEDSGLVRIYKFDGVDWQQLGQNLYGEAPQDHIPDGLSLSADGMILAVGAAEHDSPNGGDNNGFARVFHYNGSAWNLMGQEIQATAIREGSGWSVDLSADGSVLAVSSKDHDGLNGADSGGVRVFRYNTTIGLWEQVGPYLEGEAEGDQFGWEVSLSEDGSVLAIGAFGYDGINGVNSGQARVYQFKTGVGWMQIGNSIDGEDEGDRSGSGVALSANGTILAVKAGFNKATFGVERSGHVRVFRLSSPNCIRSDPVEPFAYQLPSDSPTSQDLSSDSPTSQDLSSGAIVGLVIAAIFIVGIISFLYFRKVRSPSSKPSDAESGTNDDTNESEAQASSPRDRVQSATLPGFKDQVRGSPEPLAVPVQEREGKRSNSDFLQYKDQVRNVEPGNNPSTVIAQPESEHVTDSHGIDEEPQSASAQVLNRSDPIGLSASDSKGGGAIPVALAVFLDNGEKKPSAKPDPIEEGRADTNSSSQSLENSEESVDEGEEKEEMKEGDGMDDNAI